MSWWVTPFAIQGLLMFVDEFYFHHKRGLARWEIIGHPLDTLTVLICFLFLIIQPATINNLWIYGGLSVFSSVFITKDEFVHQEKCEAAEQWLHSLLFLLHPVILGVAAYLWWTNAEAYLLKTQAVIIFLFMIYQILFWSFKREPSQ